MIELKNVSKVYNKNLVAVDNVSLRFEDGEFICFIGTSGSGKTTLMRMINRMNDPSKGEILIDGKNIMDYNPVELRRQIGYVIQQIGLLPHMTIYENIILVPTLLKWDEEKSRKIAESLIKKVDLPVEYLDMYPSELSGGQQQRIGVIRALAADQNIILMDEPFGALDPITRNALQKLVKNLQQDLKKTIIFVTHDMDEAFQLADKIVIMDKGKVVQYDTPENILKNPATAYVRDLLGEDKLNEAQTSFNTVETIMIKDPVHITEDKTAYDAISLMRRKRVDTLFVTDEDKVLKGVVGIFDLGKIGRKKVMVKSIMTEPEYITNKTKIIDAVHSIVNLQFRNLPVVDENKRLVGIVTRASIVDSIYNSLWAEDGENHD